MGTLSDYVSSVVGPQASSEKLSDYVTRMGSSTDEAPAQNGSLGDSLIRQAGLTARHAITGVTGVPAIVGNALNSVVNLGIQGTNAITDSHIPQLQMPSDLIQNSMTLAGLPEPKNNLERVVGAATSGMAGASPFIATGKALANSSAPVVQGIANTLRAAPGTQMAAGAGGGAAAEETRTLGGGPVAQLVAALLGGGAGAMTNYGAATVAQKLGGALIPKITEAIAPGSVPQSSPKSAIPAVESVTASSPFAPSPQQSAALIARTTASLEGNPGVNPQSAVRAADFGSLGMKGTLGQVSRDAGTFAQEQNMRGTELGAPLLNKFTAQNVQLGNALSAATEGRDMSPYQSGKVLMTKLQDLDALLKSGVSDAYKQAEQSSGKTLDVPLAGVAQDYAQTLHDFGEKVPGGVRNNFESLGLNSGTQKKTFTIEGAENLLKNINANRSNDPATNLALNQLSKSVKNAILSADDQGGVFAAPRALAAKRFSLMDQIPALADAANNPLNSQGRSISLPFEDFAKRHIVNGDVDATGALADFLNERSPATMDVLRGQVGNKIMGAAFGKNVAGDSVFTPDRYAQALHTTLGGDFLSKLYSPQQIDDMNTVGRVGSYINSTPAFSPRNFSNTAGATVDLLKQIPVVGKFTNSSAQRLQIAKYLRGDLADVGGLGNNAPSAAPSSVLNTTSRTNNP